MSKPKGRYPFRVPNNDEGIEFIRLCRKYKQDGMVDIKIGTNSSEVRVCHYTSSHYHQNKEGPHDHK